MTGSISNADHGAAQPAPRAVLREPIRASARVIVADPPWSFSDRLPGASRGAERNYRVMSTAGVEAFLPDLIASGGARIAPDAVLFCWRVASQVEEAYRVVRAWGFLPKSEVVWRKLTRHGKPHFGMGRIVRASHEVCIVATRGKPVPKVLHVRSVFEAPVGRHSEKPELFYDLVEELFNGPYLELFARRCRPGWVCLGDEVPSSEPREERHGDAPTSQLDEAKRDALHLRQVSAVGRRVGGAL